MDLLLGRSKEQEVKIPQASIQVLLISFNNEVKSVTSSSVPFDFQKVLCFLSKNYKS